MRNISIHYEREYSWKQRTQESFFEPYNTPHDTVPFDRIRLEDFEEAFIEGIRRDNEQIEKTINNPENQHSTTP